MLDRAQSPWNEDTFTGVLLMDIKSTFLSVARGRLIHAMNAKQIYGDLIELTETMLSEDSGDDNQRQCHSEPGCGERPTAGLTHVTDPLRIFLTAWLIMWVDAKYQRRTPLH